MPDATTLLKFRRLLETHDLCKGFFTAINADLTARGLLLREGTLVDATLIAAPPSTKNAKKERDLDMHQTKKGNQWYFGPCQTRTCPPVSRDWLLDWRFAQIVLSDCGRFAPPHVIRAQFFRPSASSLLNEGHA